MYVFEKASNRLNYSTYLNVKPENYSRINYSHCQKTMKGWRKSRDKCQQILKLNKPKWSVWMKSSIQQATCAQKEGKSWISTSIRFTRSSRELRRKFCDNCRTSSYPGWIKSPHVVTLGILKLSDLDSLTIFNWGGYSGVNFGHPKSEVFRNGGGYSRVNFGHPKSEVFRNGGGYSGVNFGHPKSEVFWNGGGGVFWSKLWSSQIWSFPKWGLGVGWGGGVFWSKLWSSQIWSFPKWGGGYSRVNFGHPKSEVFRNGGGGAFWSSIPERGFLENLDQNFLFSQKPACASQ